MGFWSDVGDWCEKQGNSIVKDINHLKDQVADVARDAWNTTVRNWRDAGDTIHRNWDDPKVWKSIITCTEVLIIVVAVVLEVFSAGTATLACAALIGAAVKLGEQAVLQKDLNLENIRAVDAYNKENDENLRKGLIAYTEQLKQPTPEQVAAAKANAEIQQNQKAFQKFNASVINAIKSPWLIGGAVIGISLLLFKKRR